MQPRWPTWVLSARIMAEWTARVLASFASEQSCSLGDADIVTVITLGEHLVPNHP